MKQTALITGANGQIGTVLTEQLRQRYGVQNVIATDIRLPQKGDPLFEKLDVRNAKRLHELIKKYKVTQIYHLAAILSAKGEANPHATWQVNMQGLFDVLEIAKAEAVQVFFPSSIAVFGSRTPAENTGQDDVLFPETVYGISKAAGEYWCYYYWKRYGVDVRSVRFPGILSHQSMPGGGTTDYAVDIFHAAARGEPFSCFLQKDTRLPMLYMADAVRAIIELMEAPAAQLSVRTSYNLAGVSFTPEELAQAIQQLMPAFQITYEPDFRQEIADDWPDSIDDAQARQDWGWQVEYDLPTMTAEMLRAIQKQYPVEVMK